MSDGGRPNILVVCGDDIGITNLSCYNDGLMGYRTPTQHRPARRRGMRFATTGMRRSEVAGLRVLDLDLAAVRVNPRLPRVLADHEVVVSGPKTRARRRSLALDPATVAALHDHLVVRAAERALVGRRYVDSGLLFTWPDGRPINPARFSAWFEQHTVAVARPRITLHGLRHSYATAALKAGVPVKVISERLGHATGASRSGEPCSHRERGAMEVLIAAIGPTG